MSRSALWRQESKAKEREIAAEETWENALAEGKAKSVKNLVPYNCNDQTFNLNRMLLQNVKKSSYFHKICLNISNWAQAVDEIYYKVNHLEEWSAGGKVPSSAYCILTRLFLLRITRKEMEQMLQHVDSPYIIGVGLLFLRYVLSPDDLWSYFKIVMDNETEIIPGQRNKKPFTIAQYAASLLDANKTQYPRIPARVQDILSSKLRVEEEKRKRKKKHLSRGNDRHFVRGSEVRGLYEDEENPLDWYDGVIMEIHTDTSGNNRYTVKYIEYGNVEELGLGEIDFRDNNTDTSYGYSSRERKRDRDTSFQSSFKKPYNNEYTNSDRGSGRRWNDYDDEKRRRKC